MASESRTPAETSVPYTTAVAGRGISTIWARGTTRAQEALRDIDLDIAPGEFVAFLGPSGCGKSTLLYLIAGLEQATNGGIQSFGKVVASPSPDRSLIFQETSLFPWLTVWQNVSFGLAIRDAPQEERRAVAARALQRVGLSAAMDKRPDELSGGMRQRVAVARALAMRPKVLLMDEPFAALDEQTRLLLGDKVLEIQQDLAQTILLITHNITEAVQLSDRILVMSYRPGRIKRVVEIALPRPRTSEIVSSDAFGRYVAEVWGDLREEASRGMRQDERHARDEARP